MRRPPAGFTIMELMFVLLIIAVLTTIGMKQFGRIQVHHRVTNARDALVYMGMRAQSAAMNRGDLVNIEIWPDTEMAKIVTQTDSTLERIRFDSQFGVTMTGSAVKACYSSRGFALFTCSSSALLPASIHFIASSDTASAVLLPLGQIEKRQ